MNEVKLFQDELEIEQEGKESYFPIVASVLKKNKCENGVIIGLGFGNLVKYLFDQLRLDVITAIDPYLPGKIYPGLHYDQSQIDLAYIRAINNTMLKWTNVECAVLRCSPVDAFPLFNERCQLDFVYFDIFAAWKYVNFLPIKEYYTIVKPGGVIAGYCVGATDRERKIYDEFAESQKQQINWHKHSIWSIVKK